MERSALERYEEQLIKPVIMNDQEIGEKWDQFRVKPAMDKIVKVSQDISAANGYSQSLSKRFNKLSLILMLASFTPIILLSVIPGISGFAIYFMFPILLVYCFLPRVLRDRMEKKWLLFVEEHEDEFKEQCGDELDRLHDFVQFLLDYTRDIIVDEDVPLTQIRIPLLSKDYNRVTATRQDTRQRRTYYVLEFIPPEGYVPPVYQTAQAIAPEDDVKDEFAVVRVKDMGDKFKAKEFTFKFVPEELHEMVNEMLDQSDFKESEAAEKFFESIEGHPEVKCSCGQPLKIEDASMCLWQGDKNFKFFFGTGSTCECGRKTYVLSAKPDKVPVEVEDIFK